jgi:hypothetical protein
MTAVATVAVPSEVSSAEENPGAELTPPAARPTKAAIGAIRYSASSPPSHGSGLLAPARRALSARPPCYAARPARRRHGR